MFPASILTVGSPSFNAGGCRNLLCIAALSLRAGHAGAGKEEGVAVHPEIINSVDTAQLNKVRLRHDSATLQAAAAPTRQLLRDHAA